MASKRAISLLFLCQFNYIYFCFFSLFFLFPLYRYTAAHTLDLYSEVAAICRPPLVLPSNEAGSFKKSQTAATGYIISVFKVSEAERERERESEEETEMLVESSRDMKNAKFNFRFSRATMASVSKRIGYTGQELACCTGKWEEERRDKAVLILYSCIF